MYSIGSCSACSRETRRCAGQQSRIAQLLPLVRIGANIPRRGFRLQMSSDRSGVRAPSTSDVPFKCEVIGVVSNVLAMPRKQEVHISRLPARLDPTHGPYDGL